jgi:hypothetical protein
LWEVDNHGELAQEQAMKAVRLVAVVGALLACWSAGVPVQAAEPAGATLPKTIKVQVKLYRDLDADSVYQAALNGIQVDVRFRDTFDTRLAVPRGMERVDLGPASYLTALAFRTRTDLLCLVPGSNLATVAQLLGIPANVPIGPAALDLPLVLNPGQQIDIEGTVIGTIRGQKYVLVDSVNAGMAPQVPAHQEVHLFWPALPDPRIITEPGQQTFEFPCTHEKGKTDSVTVTVKALTAAQLDAQLASMQGALESGVNVGKAYGQYSTRTVYGYAGSSQSINVDFTGQVQNVLDPPPALLGAATALRLGYAVQVPTVRAFVISGGPTVLIPDTWPTVLQESATVVPGESVRVRGTVIGPRGAYNCVLADFLSFPAQRDEGGDATPWWVSVEWQDLKQTFAFWDYGQYPLTGLPCQNVAGQFEALSVLASRFREYEVPQPPPAPGAAPAPTPAPANPPAAKPEDGKAVVPSIETAPAPGK